ncbi:MAG: accessory gene regulator ArgB-like protein [Caulobacteraceae bacterium]
MEFPERASKKITDMISVYLDDASEEKLAVINYGIAVFITNTYKMLLICIAAVILNIFKYFLAAFLSFGALRTFAAGVHAKREWTCLPTSSLLFLGVAYAGKSIELSLLVTGIIFILCFIAVLKYAPADTEEHPIVSKKLRAKLKVMSSVTVIALYLFTIYNLNTGIASIVTLSTAFESVLILPVAYKLLGSAYGAGININKREV